MKKYLIFLLYILTLSYLSVAQEGEEPTAQDCLGAIPICKNTYDEPSPYQYSGEGNYTNEIAVAEECYTDESNGIWYIFTAQTNGMLKFSIEPHNMMDDYDWIVFDLTEGTCEDLATNPQTYMISSNNFGSTDYNGFTGANSDSLSYSAGTCNGPGDSNGPPWNDDIPVEAGRTYVLYISNWSGSDYGYMIDFSASTAKIFDDVSPRLDKIIRDEPFSCGENVLKVHFSENVSCQSIDASDFLVSGNNDINISAVQSDVCDVGGENSKEYTLFLNQSLDPGNYALKLVSEVDDACQNSADLNGIEFEVRDIQISDIETKDNECYGDKTGEIEISAEDGDNTLSYSIDNGENYQENNSSFEALASGEYQIKVKNEFGCEKSGGTVMLSEPQLPEYQVETTDVSECYGDATGEINIQTDYAIEQYSINEGKDFTDKNNFSQLAAGDYFIVMKYDEKCLTPAEKITINQPPEIQLADIEVKNISCFGFSDGFIRIEAKGGTGELSVAIDTANAGFVTDFTYQDLSKGSYSFKIKDENNCQKQSQTLEIKEPEPLQITDYQHEDIPYNENNTGEITLVATGGTGAYSFSLNDSIFDTKGNFTNLSQGQYRATVTDENRCISDDSIFITILKEPSLVIPNIITPNNDGANDKWIIHNIDFYKEVTVQIFDRWNRLIYESQGNYMPWDGTYRQRPLPKATYYYVIHLNKKIKPLTGYITIIR